MSSESQPAIGLSNTMDKSVSPQEEAGQSSHRTVEGAEVPMSTPMDSTPKPEKVSDKPDDVPTPTKTDIPEPDGDPFEQLLEPLLKRDSDQCSTWKDEVQSILIFAGLFSAVVTAFIIESYKRLRPDPNDAIVGLLAHIADRLDNSPVNNTTPVSSIIENTSFSPSSSDISINILWFISLVFSLTAALIGIVALQWLREHQRYDPTLTPQRKLAVLHMRQAGLERWHVPKVFVGLPLLLQGALILFFAGLIEFLFALRLEVAIPATSSICIPLIFLIATTLLPSLQVCVLRDPFQLSINNNVPSPCPYKSPQSLVARRFVTASRTLLVFLTFLIRCAYVCIIQLSLVIGRLAQHDSLSIIFRTRQINLRRRLETLYFECVSYRYDNWTSVDKSWLALRTCYAASIEMSHRGDVAFSVTRKVSYHSLPAHVYDATQSYRSQWSQVDSHVLYRCAEALCSVVLDQTTDQISSAPWQGTEDQLMHVADLLYAFARFMPPPECNSITPAFIEELLHHEPLIDLQSAAGPLQAAYMATWALAVKVLWVPQIDPGCQLIRNRLQIQPGRLFQMRGTDTWVPNFVLSDVIDHQRDLEFANSLLNVFFEDCSLLQPDSDSQLVLHHVPVTDTYASISAYMEAMVVRQTPAAIANTLVHLTQLCSITPNLIQEKPFLTIAACFYLKKIHIRHNGGDSESEPIWDITIYPVYKPLLNIVRQAFGEDDWVGESVDVDAATITIWKRHNPRENITNSSTSHISPHCGDDIV